MSEQGPYTLEQGRRALQQLLDREHTLHVPPQPDDADLVLAWFLRVHEVYHQLLDVLGMLTHLRGSSPEEMARHVIAKGEEWATRCAHLEVENAELRATLAAEQGKQEGALPGWTVFPDGWGDPCRFVKGAPPEHDPADPDQAGRYPTVYHEETGKWLWYVPGAQCSKAAPTAREAMRAADAAGGDE